MLLCTWDEVPVLGKKGKWERETTTCYHGYTGKVLHVTSSLVRWIVCIHIVCTRVHTSVSAHAAPNEPYYPCKPTRGRFKGTKERLCEWASIFYLLLLFFILTAGCENYHQSGKIRSLLLLHLRHSYDMWPIFVPNGAAALMSELLTKDPHLNWVCLQGARFWINDIVLLLWVTASVHF